MLPASLALVEPPVHQGHEHGPLSLLTTVGKALRHNASFRRMVVVFAFVHTSTQVALWLYPPYFQHCGIPVVWFGVLFAVYNLTAAASSRWSCALEQRIGAANSAKVQLSVLSASYLGMAIVPVAWGALLGCLQQIVRGWLTVSRADAVNNVVSSRERATLLSLCSMAGSVLYAAVLPGIGASADRFGLPATFFSLSVIIASITGLGIVLDRIRTAARAQTTASSQPFV